MANSNFVVQNGLTVGSTTIFAGNGDIRTSGNITVTGSGSLGGVSTNQIYQGAANVTASGSYVNVAISGSNVASFSSTGLNGAAIGATSAAAGTFTTLNATSTITGASVGNMIPFYFANQAAFPLATLVDGAIAHSHADGKMYFAHSSSWNALANASDATSANTASTTVARDASGNFSANAITATTLTGTLQTASQPNVTTLAGVTSIGASSATTLTGTLQTASQPNVTTLAGVTSIGASSATTLTGTLQTASQNNITAVGTLGSLSVTGNITSGNISGTNHTGTNATLSGTVAAGTVTATTLTGGNISVAADTISSVSSTITIDPAAAGATGLVVIAGCLQVNGTTTTINSTTVTIDDLLFNVANSSATSSAANGAGLGVGPAGAEYAKLTFDNASTRWSTSVPLNVTGNLTAGNVSGTTGTFTNVGGTLLTASQPNITTLAGVTSIGASGSTTLTGTLQTASQPNITTLAGVTSIGASGSTTLTGILQTAAQTNVTSVGTLTGLTVSGAIVPNGNVSVNLGSTTAYWNNFYSATATHNTITVGAQGLLPAANVAVNIGSASNWFNVIYGKSTQAQYADLAENYLGDKSYTPGTVVMFGGAAEVTVADADSTAVAGVVSTNPAHLMNGGLTGSSVVPIALQGRVPCNVIGPVKKGDLMVSAGHGFAKASSAPKLGSIIGKALYDYPGVSKAVIEVVVGRV